MSFAKNIQRKLNTYAKNIYNHFFDYDLDKLTTFAQEPSIIIRKLEKAFFQRQFVLITYQNGKTEIGQLIARSTNGRFVLRSYDHKVYRLIDLSSIFNIEVA